MFPWKRCENDTTPQSESGYVLKLMTLRKLKLLHVTIILNNKQEKYISARFG
jgi:hypothetical protein